MTFICTLLYPPRRGIKKSTIEKNYEKFAKKDKIIFICKKFRDVNRPGQIQALRIQIRERHIFYAYVHVAHNLKHPSCFFFSSEYLLY